MTLKNYLSIAFHELNRILFKKKNPTFQQLVLDNLKSFKERESNYDSNNKDKSEKERFEYKLTLLEELLVFLDSINPQSILPRTALVDTCLMQYIAAIFVNKILSPEQRKCIHNDDDLMCHHFIYFFGSFLAKEGQYIIKCEAVQPKTLLNLFFLVDGNFSSVGNLSRMVFLFKRIDGEKSFMTVSAEQIIRKQIDSFGTTE